MGTIAKINEIVCGFVWGAPMVILLVGVGIYLTIITKGVQFRRFGYAMRSTLGGIFKKQKAGRGSVTPFQAVTTALAGSVGTGNIASITLAITLGGAGALFWLWVTALIGMCTKYAEVVLAIRFRERNANGDWVGGPMYYIKNGLGSNWRWLGVAFSIFGSLAAFGIGNAVQVGNITSAVNTMLSVFSKGDISVNVNLIVGVIIAAVVALVLLGGIKRLGSVTEKLVPFMSIVYILACLCVILANLDALGSTFALIIKGAFNPSAVVGGVGGFTLMQCISLGVKRGVFSNEAGLGSAPIAHAASSETNPVRQGMYGILEVFVDTILICTLTGITLLISGIELNYGTQGTTALNSEAIGTVFGSQAGCLIIAVGITLFALTSIFGWGLYGTRCAEYVFGSRIIKPYQLVFVLACILSATMEMNLIWSIADTLNGLMAIPNLIALISLSGIVAKLTKQHFQKK